jgi:hypothetical protein
LGALGTGKENDKKKLEKKLGTGKESVWVWECVGTERVQKGSIAPDGAGSKEKS